MEIIALVLGLFSIVGFSLFLAKFLKKSISLMPLLVVCIGMLWFVFFGMLNLLVLGGYIWYLLALVAFAWVALKEKKAILQRITPAFWLFVVTSLCFILLFVITQPMFTQWDEFTFWGAACKVVSDKNQLYTVAQSNLIAKYSPAGLVMFSYMMQFFAPSFAEYGTMAAFAILYLSSFTAATALWDKAKAGTILVFSTFFILPFLFAGAQTGEVSYSYISCMADTALASLFGGALCFYFAGGKKNIQLLLPFAVILAALTNVKDIGLALACIAWFIVLCDILVSSYKTVSFYKAKRWLAILLFSVCSIGLIGITYFGWNRYVLAVTLQDRTNVGSGGTGMGQVEMMVTGLKALLGIQPDAVFNDRAGKMVAGFFGNYQGQPSNNFRLWLFGSAFRMLLVVLCILLIAFLLADKPLKRRILAFTATSTIGFVAFSVFLTFTYTYIFKGGESETLKDYARYTMPYWYGWFMASFLLLGLTTKQKLVNGQVLPKRVLGARVAVLGIVIFTFITVFTRTNLQANFLLQSPSFYGKRLDVQHVLTQAEQEGMQADDVVYIISQGDDASRFYMFSYEMEDTEVALLYTPLEEGKEVSKGTTAASLVPAGGENGYAEAVACTPEELVAYLYEKGCTNILIDRNDGYIKQEFGSLFADNLTGWGEDGEFEGGCRYYEIVWQGQEASFVPIK